MNTSSRRTQSSCYSLSIRSFQPTADCSVFPSPQQSALKSKLQLTTRIPSNFESDLSSNDLLREKHSLRPITQRQGDKKRVKINCANPLPGQSISRRPKSPRSHKLMQTMTLERTGTRTKPFMVQRLTSLNEDSIDTKIFHAPMSCKVSTKKMKPGRKNSEAFLKPRAMLINTGTLPPKVLDMTINGGSHTGLTLDQTSTGPGSLEDLGSNDQSMLNQNVDKAEDFNRRLREIFQGTGVIENNQGSEFDLSISEEKADFTLKIFSTKQLLKSCLKREERALYAK